MDERMGHRRPRVGIVGGGPAGLTAAIAAHRLGLEAVVFERTAGIRRVSTFDYGQISVPHNSAAVVLRADLQAVLLDRALAAGVEVNWNRQCAGVELAPGLATLRFADGRGEAFDAVVAADGIHSVVRQSLCLQAKRRALGRAYLRGVAELALADDVVRGIWGRDGRRFRLCPLPGRRTYFYCSAPLGGWHATLRRDMPGWIDGWSEFGPRVQGYRAGCGRLERREL